jgi:hydroxypyruvate isomerase
MDRRTFLATGLTAGAAAALKFTSPAGAQQAGPKPKAGQHTFKLKYAPHFGQFKQHAGDDVVDQLKFIADQGFRALEDNGMMGRPVEEQEKIGREMARLGLTMGAFVAYAEFNEPTLVHDDPDARAKLLAGVKNAIEVAQRVNGKWCIVVPGCIEPRLGWDYQTVNLVEHLKAAADVCAPAGLTIVVEPLNPRDHPRLFASKIGQAYQICRAVNSPACKILDDIYHQQIAEGDLIPNIDKAWSEIAYFHLGDTPGRKEPGTGEINFRNVFQHVHAKGYQGVLGMEHGQSKDGKAGEQAVIDAYVACDEF